MYCIFRYSVYTFRSDAQFQTPFCPPKRFSGKNFAVAPVIHAGMTIQSKHMNDRNMVIEIDDHNVGKFQAVGHPIKFKKTPATVYKSSPKLGEDTKPVLKELGYTDQEISELSEKGVIQMA